MEEDKAAINRAWHKNNKRRRMSLYFDSEEQRDRLEQQAAEEGYKRFSAWCLDKIEQGARGEADPRLVEMLQEQVRKLEAAVEYERSVAEAARVEVHDLTTELRDYASKFAQIAVERS